MLWVTRIVDRGTVFIDSFLLEWWHETCQSVKDFQKKETIILLIFATWTICSHHVYLNLSGNMFWWWWIRSMPNTFLESCCRKFGWNSKSDMTFSFQDSMICRLHNSVIHGSRSDKEVTHLHFSLFTSVGNYHKTLNSMFFWNDIIITSLRKQKTMIGKSGFGMNVYSNERRWGGIDSPFEQAVHQIFPVIIHMIRQLHINLGQHPTTLQTKNLMEGQL